MASLPVKRGACIYVLGNGALLLAYMFKYCNGALLRMRRRFTGFVIC